MNQPITDYVSGATIGALNLRLTVCTSEYELRLRPPQVERDQSATPLVPRLVAA